MFIRILAIAALLLNTSCLKYKKTYHVPKEGEEGAASDEEGGGDDEGSGDDEGVELTGNLLTLLEPAAKIKAFTAAINLNGIHTKASSVVVAGGKAMIVVKGLKILRSAQMRVDLLDGNGVQQFAVRLSNINVSSDQSFRITLSKCRLKAAAATAKDKEATCDWTAEQAI